MKRLTFIVIIACCFFATNTYANDKKEGILVKTTFLDKTEVLCHGNVTPRKVIITARHCIEKPERGDAISHEVYVGAKVVGKPVTVVAEHHFHIKPESVFSENGRSSFATDDAPMFGKDVSFLFSQEVFDIFKQNPLWKVEDYGNFDDTKPVYVQLPAQKGVRFKKCSTELTHNFPLVSLEKNCHIQKGDSGSPVFQKDNGQFVFIGIISSQVTWSGHKNPHGVFQYVHSDRLLELARDKEQT